MLIYIVCSGCLMGLFIHFYIIFGSNLLTQAQCKLLFFCLFRCFAKKEYQTESKRNETSGNMIFGTNVIQKSWSGCQEINEEATRQGGTPAPRARPHPRGPLVAPPTYFFLLYISIYPENIQEHHETLFPPPQPSVPVRSHLGAFSRAPSEGALITEGLYINSMAPPMMCE